jgi:hypothetical protein
MPDTRTVKRIFNWKPLTKRSQGRPKYRWEDNIHQDICQLKIQNWIACVQDREKWKKVVEKAKISTKGSSAPEEKEYVFHFGVNDSCIEDVNMCILRPNFAWKV